MRAAHSPFVCSFKLSAPAISSVPKWAQYVLQKPCCLLEQGVEAREADMRATLWTVENSHDVDVAEMVDLNDSTEEAVRGAVLLSWARRTFLLKKILFRDRFYWLV